MPRFKRLTAAEARTLTRDQLLGRVEEEQAYWLTAGRHQKDPAGYAEFSRIFHAGLDVGAMIHDTMDLLTHGLRPGGGYMDQHPDIPDRPEKTA
jgi:hypothetical protein